MPALNTTSSEDSEMHRIYKPLGLIITIVVSFVFIAVMLAFFYICGPRLDAISFSFGRQFFSFGRQQTSWVPDFEVCEFDEAMAELEEAEAELGDNESDPALKAWDEGRDGSGGRPPDVAELGDGDCDGELIGALEYEIRS
ncbi:hypothetical protein EDC01DRAFT_783183 [Geopyxis carbonaria]|nr:hypothetical protein EDC01DRAFT_783183 [Geopyxis carbonaria]